jgi:diguanylate cyclase (GGDEF)-like protein/hemerythrin-like metal-binding protein/PAS domain S-box-containing protein
MPLPSFLSFFKQSPIAFSYSEAVFSAEGKPLDFVFKNINDAFEKLFKLRKKDVLGKHFLKALPLQAHPNDQWHDRLTSALTTSSLQSLELHFPDGDRWVKMTIIPEDASHLVCLAEDNSKSHEQHQEHRGPEEIDLDIFCVLDLDGHFQRISSQFEKGLGFSLEQLKSFCFLDLVHEEDLPFTQESVQKVANTEELGDFVSRFRTKNDHYVFLEWRAKKNGKYIFASARDVTKKIEHERRLEKEAMHDELTGLYNRFYFHKRAAEEISRASRYKFPVSMIIADIDHFKNVNDTWGHPVGDDILEKMSRLMAQNIRKSDILSRLGGEEFVVLLPETDSEGARAVAEKLRQVIASNEFPIVNRITASFGVAELRKDESFRNWYKRVDDAMYKAKESGRNQVIRFEDGYVFEPIPTGIYFEWNHNWESGNPEIDRQHRHLVEMGNPLIINLKSESPREPITRQIEQLIGELASHFAFEETVLLDLGYPEYEDHKAMHHRILAKAAELKGKYESEEVQGEVFVSFLIDDFIIGHMAEADSKFFPLTKEQSRN